MTLALIGAVNIITVAGAPTLAVADVLSDPPVNQQVALAAGMRLMRPILASAGRQLIAWDGSNLTQHCLSMAWPRPSKGQPARR